MRIFRTIAAGFAVAAAVTAVSVPSAAAGTLSVGWSCTTAGSHFGSMNIQTGGVSNVWVDISGMASPAAQDGAPYALAGGSGQITLNTVGTVTFMPQRATWAVAPNYGWTCFDPDGKAAVGASTQVLAP